MGNPSALTRLAAFGLVATAVPVFAAPSETIALSDAHGDQGIHCPQAEGVFVALLVPRQGTALLATKPFPGGREVGSVEGDRLRFTLAGTDTQELRTIDSPAGGLPIWGLVDRSLGVGRRSGCFSFGDRDFTAVDDLKTYLHWVLRDVFFRLRTESDPEPLALRLADRTVTLEVAAVGHQPVRLRAREAGLVGLRLPGAEGVYYFQPLVLDEAAGRLAVKVLHKTGPFFGEGAAQEIAFVIAGREAPGVTPTDPVLELRTAGIE